MCPFVDSLVRTTENVDSATEMKLLILVKVSNVFNTLDVTPEISGKSMV